MHWDARIANYVRVTKFPRSLFVAEDGRVVGTWIMGNDYRVKSSYYGGYPAGYLRRIKSLFPDKRRVLHLFSGKVDLAELPGDTVDVPSAWSACPCPIMTSFWRTHLIALRMPIGIRRRW
jgi:hypothetical protein